MNEEFLVYLWQFKLIHHDLTTTDGAHLQIINPGERNTNSGPDFFNARIKIDHTTWAGNAEIHVRSSDWHKHSHSNDDAYDNIILHIVYQNDVDIRRKNQEPIPTLELKDKIDISIYKKYKSFIESSNWIPCNDSIGAIDHFRISATLDSLMIERLAEKASLIKQELEKTKLDFQEVFYRKLARNFGFKVNTDAFELLAKSLPLKIISKHKNNFIQIEALLFGQSGLLEKNFNDEYPKKLKKEYLFLAEKYKLKPIDRKLWKFMRLRPANFPTIRIAQFAQLLYKSATLLTDILQTNKLNSVNALFTISASEYWNEHYNFDVASEKKIKNLGTTSFNLILINTIVPFKFVYGQHLGKIAMQDNSINWLEEIKAENNQVIKRFKGINVIPQNAMQSQALLQLKSNYCDKKRCLECKFGHSILNKV